MKAPLMGLLKLILLSLPRRKRLGYAKVVQFRLQTQELTAGNPLPLSHRQLAIYSGNADRLKLAARPFDF